jgi:hypothetical protein
MRFLDDLAVVDIARSNWSQPQQSADRRRMLNVALGDPCGRHAAPSRWA